MKIINTAGRTAIEYIKAQLILILITFLVLAVGFYFLDIRLWLLWALLLAIADFVPMFGPGIFMVPWAIICFIQGNAHLGGWILGLWIISVAVHRVAEPFIVGKNVGLRPLWAFLAMIVGGIIMGPLGFILGPLILAIAYAVYKERQKKNNIDLK